MSTKVFKRVAIAGNPNCGKSTLFNLLTGLRQKVGNYPGVTVEKKTGTGYGLHGELLEWIDLPGSYSLQVRSPDEAVSRDVLLGRIADTPPPEVIVCVVDASNLERNLYLVTQLLELNIPVILALNMVDVAEQAGIHLNVKVLAEQLGIPVVPMVATRGLGLVELKTLLSQEKLTPPQRHAPMPEKVESEIQNLSLTLKLPLPPHLLRAEVLLLVSLPDTEHLREMLPEENLYQLVEESRERLTREGIDPVSVPVEFRYQWIQAVCQGAVTHVENGPGALHFSDRMDRVLTHRIWGWVFFLAVMGLLFFSIFTVASYPMDWIDAGFAALSGRLSDLIPPGDLRSLLVEGVLAGVGGVVIFLPQILVLFFFLGVLEDSGYMSRAAFIMDRLMGAVGLHGKSFIPMLSSFACAIPGIMATRTIETRKDRLVTIMVAPLMSCSARLPVYALMIAVLFPDENTSPLDKALVMLAMYALGFLTAFFMAWIFKKTLLKSERPMLLLELPPYRRPSVRATLFRMMERGGIFLKRAGTIILAISILLWALVTYPKPSNPQASPSEAIATSFAGTLGHAMEPIIKPLGYDWKIGIGLIASFAAREVFVGTMAIVYNVSDETENNSTLRHELLQQKRADGSPVYTPLVCIGLMVFYVLAMQCVSTLAIVKRETNSWRWPLFQFAYMTALAWIGALIVYQGGHWLGFQ
jgi:ferrous iron transport protein B